MTKIIKKDNVTGQLCVCTNIKFDICVLLQLEHQLFWQRFLFRKALLEDEEARKQAKQRRLEEEKQRIEADVTQSKLLLLYFDGHMAKWRSYSIFNSPLWCIRYRIYLYKRCKSKKNCIVAPF